MWEQMLPFAVAMLGVALLLFVLLYRADRRVLANAGLLSQRAALRGRRAQARAAVISAR